MLSGYEMNAGNRKKKPSPAAAMAAESGGHQDDGSLQVDLAVNDRAETFIFHYKPFDKTLSWLEFDMDSGRVNFVMDDGEHRDFGIPVRPELGKYLQNAHQVLLVLMDMKTGQPVGGNYYPLLIHRA